MKKRLFGILVPVILGFSLGVPAASASAASTARAAGSRSATHSLGARVAATPQFLAALKEAREAGRGVAAADPTGICWSGSSLCWRDMPSGAIDMWNRDISGDGRQQWTVIYEGTANQTGCPINGNYGVYAFRGSNGSYASAGDYNGNSLYWVGDGTSFDYWDWNPNGTLGNCADTRNNPGNFYAYSIGYRGWQEGEQLYTNPTGSASAFQQIHV